LTAFAMRADEQLNDGCAAKAGFAERLTLSKPIQIMTLSRRLEFARFAEGAGMTSASARSWSSMTSS